MLRLHVPQIKVRSPPKLQDIAERSLVNPPTVCTVDSTLCRRCRSAGEIMRLAGIEPVETSGVATPQCVQELHRTHLLVAFSTAASAADGQRCTGQQVAHEFREARYVGGTWRASP